MELTEDILKEWFGAVRASNEHLNNKLIYDFKKAHKEEYACLSSFFRLRGELFKDIEALSSLGSVQWFTLTYDEEHDGNKEETKRKQAFDFLNTVFLAFVLVEEHGELYGRYHIHGFAVYRRGKGFEDFRKWFSAQKIRTLENEELHKKVKYLTKYAVKALPRLRRNKTLCRYKKEFSLLRRLKEGFKTCFACRLRVLTLKYLGL